ncbi:MAG: hypothetical protein ABIH83_01165 [Candidatus Micrarchaeota archaeon]
MTIVEELRSKISKEEFETGVREKLEEFHHLITKESAEYLLALEKIGAKAKLENIESAKLKGIPCILNARVERVFLPQIFEKGGEESRTQRMQISDQTGGVIVACYDEGSKKIDKEIVAGDLAEIGPVRFRGEEFHLLPKGNVRRIQKGARGKLKDEKLQVGNFEGKVVQFQGDFPYKKGQARLVGEGETALMSSFELEDGSGKKRVVVWDSPGMKNILKKGMEVEIENGNRRNGEVHIGKGGRLVFDRKEEKRPEIERIEINEGEVKVFAKEKTIVFENLEEACFKFGIGKVPEGIKEKTALELKKNDWVGKPLPLKWEKN